MGLEIMRDSEIDYEAEAKNAVLANPPTVTSLDDEVADIHRCDLMKCTRAH